MTRKQPEFHRLVPARDLAGAGRRALTAEADEAERRSLAEALDLLSLQRFRFTGALAPAGAADWRLSGEIEAEVTQSCVVTLAPVTAQIRETVERRYSPAAADEDEVEFDPLADDPPEPLGDGVDFGAAALEALVLAIDPYPRAPGAAFAPLAAAPPGAQPMSEEEARPFAGLAALKKAMERPS